MASKRTFVGLVAFAITVLHQSSMIALGQQAALLPSCTPGTFTDWLFAACRTFPELIFEAARCHRRDSGHMYCILQR